LTIFLPVSMMKPPLFTIGRMAMGDGAKPAAMFDPRRTAFWRILDPHLSG
jgi:hypothetical protein